MHRLPLYVAYPLCLALALFTASCETPTVPMSAEDLPLPPVDLATGSTPQDLQAPPKLEPTIEPAELIFSGVRQTMTPPQVARIRNPTSTDIDLMDVKVQGEKATAFVLDRPMPLRVPAMGVLELPLRFSAPSAGVFSAELSVILGGSSSLTVSLYGLGTQGQMGGNEPPLSQVVQVLGYAINVGGTGLTLGTGAAPIGDEVLMPLFKKAGPGKVTLRPVARYSPSERLPYGFYHGTPVTRSPLGAMVAGANAAQTLHPEVEPGSVLEFEPDGTPFGLFTQSQGHITYTEDRLNAMLATKHAVRVYPAKDRGGRPILNTYLLGFEEAANGDYQDYVFVLGNVTAP